MKSLFLLFAAAAILAAQDQSSSASESNPTRGITAASEFFDHDFVNFFAYANGIWDSRGGFGTGDTQSTLGWEAGGGITATHTFRDGGLTLNYRGGYRDYTQISLGGTGVQQQVAFAYDKRLNRRWTFGANVSGAILGYGSSFYSASSVGSFTPASALSTESRSASAGINLTYAQTRRLSYVFSGNFLYTGYKVPAGVTNFGSKGVVGSASVLYRLTPRTTIGGSYSRIYFVYSGTAGTSNIDGGTFTLSHQFPEHWQIDLSGGVNRTHSSGTETIPVQVILNSGQVVTLYATGPYSRTVYVPVFQGVLTHAFRKSSASVSAGQSVMGGNGTLLTSRDEFVNGSFSRSTRHTNVSFGGNYVRMASISNNVTRAYSYYGASASLGVNLIRYVSANVRYDLLHYDQYGGSSLLDNRVTFGLSLSTKSVPLTLF